MCPCKSEPLCWVNRGKFSTLLSEIEGDINILLRSRGTHVSASVSLGIALQTPRLSSRWRYYLIPYSHPTHVRQFSMQNPIVMQTHTFEQSAIEEDWADWGIERRLQGKHLRMLKISCGGGPARQCPSIFALKGHFTAIGNSSCPFSAQQRK